MALNVFLGIWDEDKLRRVKVDDVDLDSNVDILKPHLTKELGENAPEEFGLYSRSVAASEGVHWDSAGRHPRANVE